VLHGCSGVADAASQSAIRAGTTKINVSTHLNKVLTGAVREFLAADPDVVDTRKWMRAGRDAAAAEAERVMRLFRDAALAAPGDDDVESSGTAAAAAARARRPASAGPSRVAIEGVCRAPNHSNSAREAGRAPLAQSGPAAG